MADPGAFIPGCVSELSWPVAVSDRWTVCRRQMAAADAAGGGRRYATTAEYCAELRLWMARVQQTRSLEALFPVWLSQQLAAGSAPQQQQQRQVTDLSGRRCSRTRSIGNE